MKKIISKKAPIKKIYLSIIFILAIVFLWFNQGLSNDVLADAFNETIKTLTINNVTVGELYVPLRGSPGMNSIHGDIERADLTRYNKIVINITICNPSDFSLEINMDRFNVYWMSEKGYTQSIGGIENDKRIIIESGKNMTLMLEGIGFEGYCTNYIRRTNETPELLFDTHMYATTSKSNGRHISYSTSLNLDGSLHSEYMAYIG